MTFTITVPGVYNYSPLTPQQCNTLATLLYSAPITGYAPVPGLSPFVCTSIQTMPTASQMTVCANGDLRANDWETYIEEGLVAPMVADALGYDKLCDVYVTSNSSCGTDYAWGLQCQSPDVDFPHNCFPGNTAANGGKGTITSGTKGTPFEITSVTTSGKSLSFTVSYDASAAACNPAYSTPMKTSPPNNCCQMTLDKLELVISKQCHGQVKTLTVNGNPVATSYGNNTYLATPPGGDSWYQVFKVTRLGGYTGDVEVGITLRDGPCGSVDTFLPGGKLWYAYFNGNAIRNCCGTSAFPVA